MLDASLKQVAQDQEIFEFTYPDSFRPGVTVTEQVVVNKKAGRFYWSRCLSVKDGADNQGSCWSSSQVVGVRFVTQLGDPCREFVTPGQRQVARRRGFTAWLSSTSPVLLTLLIIAFNPLTFTLVFAICMSYAVWEIFPRRDYSGYDMSQGPNNVALGWAGLFSILVSLSSLFAAWWLGGFTCRCCPSPESLIPRLHARASKRWRIQKPLNTVFLHFLMIWALWVFIMCPLSAGLSRTQECDAGGCVKQAGSNLEPVCGIGGCSCGSIADLSCLTAQSSKDLSLCRTVKQPLCAVKGSGVTTSGFHLPLIVAAFGTAIFTGLLGLIWLINSLAIALHWTRKDADQDNDPAHPRIRYHRFAVTFRSRAEGRLVFNLSADEDPQVVVSALMPIDGSKLGLAGMSSPILALRTGLDTLSTGTTMPVYMVADDAEPEPQWC